MSRKITYQVRGTHKRGGYFTAERDKLWLAEDDAAQYFTDYRIYRITEELVTRTSSGMKAGAR